jgi:RNase adaptor protein for sRNA GlmZ degradation
MTNTVAPAVQITSFGYLHTDTPPTADLTIDLRRFLADPAHVPGGAMLDMTGLDPVVADFVFATPGAQDLLDNTVWTVLAMLKVKPHITVAAGCKVGKHRAAAYSARLRAALVDAGVTADVQHLHVHLPRVIR